jgi:hypothetical protein
MFPRLHSPRPLFAAVVLLGLAARANAELAATSPFLPPQGQMIMAPTAGAPLEFRGVTTMEGHAKFSIFDPAQKKSTWIGLNETGFDFAVKKYDPDSDVVTVDYQGRSLTLAMRTPKVASLGTAVPPPQVPIVGPVPMPNAAQNLVTRNVVAAPTPATEAARLADWQAEIQRRRDMRAQQATTQPAQPAPQVAQPQVQTQPQPNQPQNGQRQRGGQGGPQRRAQ